MKKQSNPNHEYPSSIDDDFPIIPVNSTPEGSSDDKPKQDQDPIEEKIKTYFSQIGVNPKGIKKLIDDAIFDLKKEFTNSTDEIKQKVTNAEEDMQKSKLRVTETLGIFVSLFTFISITFQVLKDAKDIINVTGLILILLGSLILFNILLHLLMQSRKKRNEFTDSFFDTKNKRNPFKEFLLIVFYKKPILLILNYGTLGILFIISLILIGVGSFVITNSSIKNSSSILDTTTNSSFRNQNNIIIQKEASTSAE